MPVSTPAETSVQGQKAPKPLWRRILRKVGWVFLGLFGLVVLLIAFIHTPWGKDFVKSRAEKALAKRVTGSLSIGKLDYGFMFSDVELGEVVIANKSGARAISVDKLYVDLDRGSLLDGKPILEAVEIAGVRVDIVKNADGSSNLTGLFVPSERKGRIISIKKLAISDVGVSISRPDGSSTVVSDVSIAGAADINTVDRKYNVELTELGAAARITRPDGTIIEIPKASTSVSAVVTAESIDATLARLETEGFLTKPGEKPQPVKVVLGKTTVERSSNRTKASIDGIEFGPLTIKSIAADVEIADRKMVGEQSVDLVGVRVEHEGVEPLLGRPLAIATDVDVNLSVKGQPENLVVIGGVGTAGGALTLTGEVDGTDLDKPAFELELSSNELDTSQILAPRPKKPLPEVKTNLSLEVSGTGIPRRPGSVTSVDLTVGPSEVDARGKRVGLDKLEIKATARGQSIDVDKLFVDIFGVKVAASGSMSEDKQLTAKVAVDGDPATAAGRVRNIGVKVRPLPLPNTLDLDVSAKGNLDGTLAVTIQPTSIRLAGGTVRILSATAELEERKLTSADASVRLGGVRIEKLARIAGRKTKLAGRLDGTVNIKQRGQGRNIGYDVKANLEDPAVNVAARGSLGATSAKVTADVFARELGEQVATVKATVPLRQRGGKRGINPSGRLSVDAVVAERTLAEIKKLAPPRIGAKIDARASSGNVGVKIKLAGTPKAPTGTIELDAKADLVKLPGTPVVVDLSLALSPSSSGGVTIAPTGTIAATGVDGDVATIGGKASIGPLFRRGKLDREGALAAAKLGVTVTVPERELKSLAPLRPKLADLPGNIGLEVTTAGTPKAPEFTLNGGWTDYETATGDKGRIGIEASGTPKAIRGELSLGTATEKPVKLAVVADRRPTQTIIGIDAKADKVALERLLPKRASEHGLSVDYGTLDWNMNGEVKLATGDKTKLETVDLEGFLDVSGASVGIPKSNRRYKDVGLRIEGDGAVVRLAHFRARESDEEVDNRSVELSAETSLAGGVPKQASAKLKAHRWLVFGGSLGHTDAPRAVFDADIDVAADLSGAIPEIDATINALTFSEPDHSDRDHALQHLAVAGDIVFTDSSKIPVGKLGAVRTGDPPPPRKRRPMLVRLNIPKPISVEKTPLNIVVSGNLEIAVKEDGVLPKGDLEVHKGKVLLFGHQHEFESGTIAFDEQNPAGKLSLTFARELPPATLRRLSRVSGGRSVKLTIAGTATDRKIILSGAGNAGMLEVMSAHNAGRAYYFTEPDLHATNSVQAPQLLQPLVLTYLATNLPHMLVLDRFSSWSDPYDERDSYGRVEHFEGERNSVDQKSRVRVIARPRTLGRSQTEVHLDRYLYNRASMAIGAGIRAGSRLGGGVAVFFEWTSDD